MFTAKGKEIQRAKVLSERLRGWVGPEPGSPSAAREFLLLLYLPVRARARGILVSIFFPTKESNLPPGSETKSGKADFHSKAASHSGLAETWVSPIPRGGVCSFLSSEPLAAV